ncbi:alpha/beta fold hydrolase [Nocardiopsis dassonvillei]|uniref:Alpha/beta hydrolase fold protein n=1 Tax=Nocardiopsis dassonvillei (strain ATCC 23218 / DSM 43111 / CIP 107115 / JCM 7437 / KCTC 9190 / NBRC 14626 / NCTC 10488 / NRRL B-5397 / IMRU 509) TaxID=446468 RepID=D7B159_NOCDD|nr:alpha/beta hydrolase [Nocardiopsis dassonvillei]ADH66450.1 alpha/beta hydrolase fold protein [Nocardiopsis dassonvillei subsp. dassonvillei DSM 43111]NKY77811.1 alpha/beta hydrolase [Nocardiopsis dassonvillei]VEI92471.1 Carboxylesterase ybfK [Nocardiopsis dassonvillei]
MRKKKRNRWIIVACAVVVAVLLAAVTLRTPSPVGHWRSAEGRDAFTRTYEAAMADLPRPAAEIDVRTDYGVVRMYRFEGAGDREEPLVLLPGRAAPSPVWADNLPSLLEVGDVYTVDLLGEPGMSVQDRPIEDDADQAAWLHQALDGLPEEGFHLVGLSFGGWSVTNLAVREPSLVASVTLVDPVFVFDDMPMEVVLRSLPASLPWLPRSWRDGFNSWTAGGAPVEDVPVARMIESGMQNYAIKLPQPGRISEESLTDLDMPVLAFVAGRSVMHDLDTAAATAERALLHGTVEVYPEASHAINGEYPEEMAADIDAFLDEVDRS